MNNKNAIPKELQKIVVNVMRRFTIHGVCDGMYIANVIAHGNETGNGEGYFTGETKPSNRCTATYLQLAYSYNILPSEIDELLDILNGKFDFIKATNGIREQISRLKKERKTADEWRKDYLAKSISIAWENIKKIKEEQNAA